MDAVRIYLQQEFQKKAEKNPRYSLRAFARLLDVDHATLSSMLSGKRKITSRSARNLLQSLGVAPAEANALLVSELAESVSTPYFLVQQDAFASISEWYFDAILELVDVVGGRLAPDIMAAHLSISPAQATVARDTLVRLGLLVQSKKGLYQRSEQDSTNILDPDSTNAAMKRHQRTLAEKSVVAVDEITKTDRDHTSLCLAFDRADLPEAKALIAKFRKEFNKKFGKKRKPDSVYQLQVALFPLTKSKGKL
ncbi:MAG: TIGR02147 family protein [Bdellovibrionota bacterium]